MQSKNHWSASVSDIRGVPKDSILFSTTTPWILKAIGSSGFDEQKIPRHWGQPGVPRTSTTTVNTNCGDYVQLLPHELTSWSNSPLPSGEASPLSATSVAESRHRHKYSGLESTSEKASRNVHRQDTDPSQIETTHLIAQPPSLRRRAPIALPSLPPHTRVQVHPIISYHSTSSDSGAPVYWDISLPPSNARLATSLTSVFGLHWSREAAVAPGTLSSLTIRIMGVERPVVVFPAEMGGPIRIIDVLWEVHVALFLEALGFVYDRAAGGGTSNGIREVSMYKDAVSSAIRAYFDGYVWWGGLGESSDERDVWILELCGAKKYRR